MADACIALQLSCLILLFLICNQGNYMYAVYVRYMKVVHLHVAFSFLCRSFQYINAFNSEHIFYCGFVYIYPGSYAVSGLLWNSFRSHRLGQL